MNVKSDDLLWVDQENPDHTPDDTNLYDQMGVDCEPFHHAKIIAPEHPEREGQPKSDRLDAKPFSLKWKDVGTQYRLLVSQDDINDNLARLLEDLAHDSNMRTFQQVKEKLEKRTMELGKGDIGRVTDSGGRHYRATIVKGVRVIEGLLKESNGLYDGKADAPDIGEMLIPGQFTVIDIAQSTPKEQRIIVSMTRKEVQRRLERKTAEVDHVLFLADELNKFAPRRTTNDMIKEVAKEIVETAERGRSIGIALLGIEQYPSNISESVTGNVATQAFSRMRMSELSNPLYRTLSKEKKEVVTRLESGFMMVDFDNFQEPVLTRYPRAPCAQQAPEIYDTMNELWRSAPPARRGEAVNHLRALIDSDWETAEQSLDDLERLHVDEEILNELIDQVPVSD